MRSLKKATALLVAVAMIFSLCSFGVVLAAEPISFVAKADQEYVAPGETVTVNIVPNTTVTAANSSALEYKFDSTKFTVVCESGAYTVNSRDGLIRAFANGDKVLTPETVVFTLKITVNADTEDGVYIFENSSNNLKDPATILVVDNAEKVPFSINVGAPASATPEPTPNATYVATLNVTGGNGVLKNANGNVYPTVAATEAPATPTPTATIEPEEPTPTTDTALAFNAKADKDSISAGETITVDIVPNMTITAANSSALEYKFDSTKFTVVCESGAYTVNSRDGLIRAFANGDKALTPETIIFTLKITANADIEDGVYVFENSSNNLKDPATILVIDGAEKRSFEIVVGSEVADPTPTPTDEPADPTPTIDVKDAVSISAVVLPEDFTIPEEAVIADNELPYAWNDQVTDEMKSVFGDPLNAEYIAKVVPMNVADREISIDLAATAEEAGSYKMLILSNQYKDRYHTVSVDGAEAVSPVNTIPQAVADCTEDTKGLAVCEYEIGDIAEGTHTITIKSNSQGNSRNIFAAAFVKVGEVVIDPTPTPTDEPVGDPTPTPDQVADPTPTADAGDVTGDVIAWTFGEDTSSTITEKTVNFDNGLSYISDGSKSAYAGGAECDGITFTNRIKLGGKSTFTAGSESRVFVFTPSESGTVTVYFVSGSNKNDGRHCVVQQNGNTIINELAVEQEVDGVVKGIPTSATANVEAGVPVYVGSDNNIGIYGITFTPGASVTAEVNGVQYLIPAGDVVTFDGTPDVEGSTVTITVDGTVIDGTTFVMPEKDITVDVVYTVPPLPTATPTAEPTATPTAEPTATPTIEPDQPTATPTVDPDQPTATPTVDPDQPTATPTAEPVKTYTVTFKATADVTEVTIVNIETGASIKLEFDGENWTAEVPDGSYSVEFTTVDGKEVDRVATDMQFKVDGSDVTQEVVTIDATDVAEISIKTMPKLIYAEGEEFDPTGLVITATMTDGSTKDVEYSAESGITIKPLLNGIDYEVIYGNKATVVNTTIVLKNISVSVAVPEGGKTISTVATASEDANYTLSEVVWTPASSTGKFAYKTAYTAKVTVTPNGGYVFGEDLNALVNGNEVSNVTVNEDGTVTVSYKFPATRAQSVSVGSGSSFSTSPSATTAPTSEPRPTAAPGEQVFEDVPSTYWAYDYIMNLYNAGVVDGASATTFLPENNVTRAEFTKMAVQVFGLKATAVTTQFTDVAAEAWYAEFVSAALEAGIVTGVSATEFDPDAQVTREQMAAIIGRYLGTSSDNAAGYTDDASIEDYAKPYVAGLTENGLLKGYEDKSFRPQANATRAEAATLIDRVRVQLGAEADVTATPAPEAEATATAAPEVTAEPEATATAATDAE